MPPEPPTLEEALELEVTFGKFHGHTLGEIAAFEPSYIDWLAVAPEGKLPMRSGTPEEPNKFIDGWKALETGSAA